MSIDHTFTISIFAQLLTQLILKILDLIIGG